MTNKQINNTIAKACGWKLKKHYWLTPEGCEAFGWDIPDYSTDLNAMHEAEKGLENPDCYEKWLADVCGGTSYLFHATAQQRAEAFLKTLGKWKGD
jgi:hypothetical protein